MHHLKRRGRAEEAGPAAPQPRGPAEGPAGAFGARLRGRGGTKAGAAAAAACGGRCGAASRDGTAGPCCLEYQRIGNNYILGLCTYSGGI